MWGFEQSTGWWYTPESARLSQGYSGHGLGRNNPEMESVADVGPIPVGLYTIQLITDAAGQPIAHKDAKGTTLAAPVMRLIPDADNEMYGRTDFLCHGNNATNDASLGCAIADHDTRVTISTSTDNRLQVVKTWPPIPVAIDPDLVV